jgi:RNA polymerase sigma factor (sigma-70 family)
MAGKVKKSERPEGVAYTDEFGKIGGEVNNVLNDLLPRARNFALSKLQDESEGDRLLRKAAASVERVYCKQPDQIDDLHNYLFTAFKHLVIAELKRRRRVESLDDHQAAALVLGLTDVVDNVEQKILLEEIMQRMETPMREIFEMLILGYTFEDIAKEFGEKSNKLRSRFSKLLAKLIKQLNKETLKS